MSGAPARATRGVAASRGWELASAALLAAAIAGRIHNAVAFPPLLDFDGAAHALYVFSLREGALPDWKTWAGFHPPLYYAVGAALWSVLPESVPVHTGLRLLSAAAGLGAVAIAWRVVARFTTAADAGVVAASIACTPVVALATSMFGNETTCALFATAALAGLVHAPREPRIEAWHAIGSGLLAALAAFSKSTGLLVVGFVALGYALRVRRAGAAAVARVALAVALPAALLLVPFYAPRLWENGSLRSLVRGGSPSDAFGSEMAAQPPGERHLGDYFLLPPAMLAAPFTDAPGMLRSVPGLLWASTWADGHGQFLPARMRSVVGAASVSALLGLFPSALAIAGSIRLVRRRAWPGAGWPLGFAVALLAAWLVQVWLVPVFSAVKASYLLSALLAGALALAAGLDGLTGAARMTARAALLAIGAFQVFLFWYGWWS
jgi:hypothetical protein